jgi:hypothetical protein
MRITEGVATFVGIDAHASQCSMKAVSQDAVDVLSAEVVTREANLRQVLDRLPRPVWAMLEASTMALFVWRCLQGVVDRVIV